MTKVCAIVVAAGKSERMGGGDKLLLQIAGKPVLRRCLEAFESCMEIDSVCLVTSPERMEIYRGLAQAWGISKLHAVVAGGATRTVSVVNGLRALPPDCEIAAIQDGARPFVTHEIIHRTIESARLRGSGVAAVNCRDTVKAADEDNLVQATLDRRSLRLMQTPQTFRYSIILQAYEKAIGKGHEVTDDAAILELSGGSVYLTEGSQENIKITTPEDIRLGEAIAYAREGSMNNARIGEGYDAHRLMQGRKLILGGVEIPHETGLLGHSDADVLVHAVMDALLGAVALGDIGKHFPDTDAAYEGISSMLLLEKVAGLLKGQGYSVGNIDATIAAQRPKLAPHIPLMRENIARALGIPVDRVSVKATTTEGMGFEGREEGISARAVALVFK